MKKVAQKIAIDQVELSTIPATFKTSINNVISFFVKLSDTYNISKEIKDWTLRSRGKDFNNTWKGKP